MSETLELVENDLMLIIINMFKDLKENKSEKWNQIKILGENDSLWNGKVSRWV